MWHTLYGQFGEDGFGGALNMAVEILRRGLATGEEIAGEAVHVEDRLHRRFRAEQGEAGVGVDRLFDMGDRAEGDGVGIHLNHIVIRRHVENGQQALPGAAPRAGTDIDIPERQNLRIIQMMAQQRTVARGQSAIVHDDDAATAQMLMERLYRDHIGRHHRRPDHREQDDPVLLRADRRGVEDRRAKTLVHHALAAPDDFSPHGYASFTGATWLAGARGRPACHMAIYRK